MKEIRHGRKREKNEDTEVLKQHNGNSFLFVSKFCNQFQFQFDFFDEMIWSEINFLLTY